MRSGKIFILLGLALTVAFIGCGDDDGPTTSVGSLSDPEFLAVQGQLDQFVDSTIQFMQDGFGAMTAIASTGEVDPIYYGPGYPGADSVTASYINGWNVINVSLSGVGYNFGIIDSVKFFVNGQVNQTGVNADSLYYRHKWQISANDTTASYINMEGFSGFDIRGLNSNEALIDGSNDYYVEARHMTNDSVVWRQFEFSAEVSNFGVTKGLAEWGSACPHSGTISATLAMTYQKDQNQAIESAWDITLTFTDGLASVNVQHNNTVWSYTTDVCTPTTSGQ